MEIRDGVVLRDKAALAQRAGQRLAAMLTGGALDEVAALLARDLPADRPVLRALGVREIGAMLAGDIDREEAHGRILKVTLAYQKRQLTWARGRQADWAQLDSDARVSLDDLTSLDLLAARPLGSQS
jgi:tRNA dimethylallyltransferase